MPTFIGTTRSYCRRFDTNAETVQETPDCMAIPIEEAPANYRSYRPKIHTRQVMGERKLQPAPHGPGSGHTDGCATQAAQRPQSRKSRSSTATQDLLLRALQDLHDLRVEVPRPALRTNLAGQPSITTPTARDAGVDTRRKIQPDIKPRFPTPPPGLNGPVKSGLRTASTDPSGDFRTARRAGRFPRSRRGP